MRKQRRGPALFELLHGDRSQRAEVLHPPGLRIVPGAGEDHGDEPDLETADRVGSTEEVGDSARSDQHGTARETARSTEPLVR
mgnify:CR=1 FL=1